MCALVYRKCAFVAETLNGYFNSTPVHLRIHAIIISVNYMASVQCIQPCIYRPKDWANVHIKLQNAEKCDLRDFDCDIVVGIFTLCPMLPGIRSRFSANLKNKRNRRCMDGSSNKQLCGRRHPKPWSKSLRSRFWCEHYLKILTCIFMILSIALLPHDGWLDNCMNDKGYRCFH